MDTCSYELLAVLFCGAHGLQCWVQGVRDDLALYDARMRRYSSSDGLSSRIRARRTFFKLVGSHGYIRQACVGERSCGRERVAAGG